MLVNSIFIGDKQPTKSLVTDAEKKWNWYIKRIQEPDKPEDQFSWNQEDFTLFGTHINDYLFTKLQKYDLIMSQFSMILLNEIVFLNKYYVDPSNSFLTNLYNITGEKLVIHFDGKDSGVLFCKNLENDRVISKVYMAYKAGSCQL